MKKFTKILAIILAVMIPIFMFAGCAAASKDYADAPMAPDIYDSSDNYYSESSKGDYVETPDEPTLDSGLKTEGSSADAAIQTDFAQKIIYSAYYTIETKEFDSSIEALNALISKYGGFVENSNVRGYTYYDSYGNSSIRNRTANYVVRIPSANLNDFLNESGSLGSVTSKRQEAQNVTSQYADISARLETYEVQEKRLLELLAKASDMKDLLTIEDKLSEVRYNIESLQRSLNNIDAKVDYSTVTLNINEVSTYTPTEKMSFWERLGNSFIGGIEDFVDDIGDFVIWFVGALPALILIAAIVVVAVILLKKARAKKRAKKVVDNTEKQ